MKSQYRAAAVFLMLSLVFALMSMPDSSALNRGRFARQASARISKDENALLELDGLNDMRFDAGSEYTGAGSITNNTDALLNIKVRISPDFSSINNKNCILGIRLGLTSRYFTYYSTEPEEIILLLLPRQSINVQVSIDKNANKELPVSFDITANDIGGRMIMHIRDTKAAPRRIICY